MAYPRLEVNRLNNQLQRQGAGSGEGVAALVLGGVAVSGGAQLNTVYKLFSRNGAEQIGLTASYDSTNAVLVHYHIEEFFALNPSGELHVMLVPQGTTLAAMVDKDNDFLKKVLRAGEGRIRKAGVVLNPDSDYTPTLLTGLDDDVLAAIPLAQQLADDEYSEFRTINNIVIEGRQFNGTVGDAADLRNLTNGPYRDVSVCIAQDQSIAVGNALFAHHAAVGSYLGLATNKQPAQSFAQAIQQFNLTRPADSRFMSSYLSNNQPLSNLTGNDIAALSEKGYIFGRTFPNYSGVYFNQSHVCAPPTDDYDNSELRDVMNAFVRASHPVMIPYVNDTQWEVESTGRIVRRQTALVEASIRSAYDPIEDQVSEIVFVIIDPAKDNVGQDYPSFLDDRTLRMQVGLRPRGKSEIIILDIAYTR